MSFSDGFYAGMALGDRIKENLQRPKKEATAAQAKADRENQLFAQLTPEQRQTYLSGQNFADGTPEADLHLKRQRMVEAQVEANRQAKVDEVAGSLEVDHAVKQMRLEGARSELAERFAKMTPQQQADFHAQEQAPVGIGVLRPEARTPEMLGFVARGQVAQAGQQRLAEAAQQQRLEQVAAHLLDGRKEAPTAKPTATVQYGPDGSVQRQWVRGGAPVPASVTPTGQNAQPVPAAVGGVPEIGSREEFDRLPAGAPFVFRGQRGVKR